MTRINFERILPNSRLIFPTDTVGFLDMLKVWRTRIIPMGKNLLVTRASFITPDILWDPEMDKVLLMIDIFQVPLRENLTSTIPHYYISFLCFTPTWLMALKRRGHPGSSRYCYNQLQGWTSIFFTDDDKRYISFYFPALQKLLPCLVIRSLQVGSFNSGHLKGRWKFNHPTQLPFVLAKWGLWVH